MTDSTREIAADVVVVGGGGSGLAAAITAGDSDQLMIGRNGVFYDRKGHDWDATIIKIIEHPISIRQAFWLPYKRVGRMVGEQLEKFATARAKTADSGMTTILDNAAKTAAAGAASATAPPSAPPPPPPPTFDVAKFAGIFAAIGLAILVVYFRNRGSIEVEDISTLKG